MRYWKKDNEEFYFENPNDMTLQGTHNVEITKAEFDAYNNVKVVIPKLAKENTAHQVHQNTETAMAKEMTRYENSLFETHLVTLTAVVPLGTKFVTNVLSLANKVKYDQFQLYRKVYATIALLRSNILYDAVVNQGLEVSKALELANAKTIPLTDTDALQAKTDFENWLRIEHPELDTYLLNSASLKYSTFLTEDEADV